VSIGQPDEDVPAVMDSSTSAAMPVHDWQACSAVERDAAGTGWVFRGSQVPISALFEYLEDGETLSDFCEFFPDLPAEQVRAVMEHAGYSV
jgi:hypothetical protein